MAEDWDLFAIVRSCQSATNSAAATTSEDPATAIPLHQEYTCSSLLTNIVDDEFDSFSFPNKMVQPPLTNEFQELEQLVLTPFIDNPTTTTSITIPNSPDFSQLHHHLPPTTPPELEPPLNSTHQQLVHQKQELHHQPQPPQNSSALLLPIPQPQTPRSRKRKSQQKKMVCHVTADNLSTDLWAWRKYGQKPIKGSPYPRNYYRCSSSKGCSARKQVERSNVETDMFIVTYTGDHTHPRPTHRNSLAGSTRSKSPAINPPPSSKVSTEPPENDIADDSDENGGPAGPSSQRTEPA